MPNNIEQKLLESFAFTLQKFIEGAFIDPSGEILPSSQLYSVSPMGGKYFNTDPDEPVKTKQEIMRELVMQNKWIRIDVVDNSAILTFVVINPAQKTKILELISASNFSNIVLIKLSDKGEVLFLQKILPNEMGIMLKEEYITEIFDKPYPFQKELLNDLTKYSFESKNKFKYNVVFDLYKTIEPYVSLEFYSNKEEEEKPNYDITGSGDAYGVFSTIVAIIKDYISSENIDPNMKLVFTGKEKSRTKLYKTMLRKYNIPYSEKEVPPYQGSPKTVTHISLNIKDLLNAIN